MVVHGTLQPLLAAQVSLRRLHRYVAHQKRNLLKLPAGRVAETRTCAATIPPCGLVQQELCRIQDYAELDCDRVARSPVRWSLIEVGRENDAA